MCLGDLVGYGASPNECVEQVRALTDRVVVGNHDMAAVGMEDLRLFNSYARAAAIWTAAELTEENAGYLRTRPMTIQAWDAIFVHATPYDPGAWHYVYDSESAEGCFAHTDQPLCFLGHSHVPFVYIAKGRKREIAMALSLSDGCRYVVNVGSVGQPRDKDSRAAFAIWDRSEARIEIVRVDYEVEAAQRKIVDAGLPPFLAERLASGR